MLDAPATSESSVTSQQPPAIGAEWQGGVYIGRTLHDNQLFDLVVLPEQFRGTWQQAMDWAAKQDAVLPSRVDHLMMLPHRDALKMDKAWYWSGDTHPEYPAYAWCQDFGTGSQYYDSKDYYYGDRARAVRRLVIK